jgi:Scaffold protein Nfu/NifU N terminal
MSFLLQLMKFSVGQRLLPESFGTSLTLTKADTDGQERCRLAKALLTLDSVSSIEICKHSITVTKNDLAPW